MNATDNLPRHSLRPGRPVCTLGVRVGALLASGALALTGCTAGPLAPVIHAGVPRAADVTLVRFTSCADALRNLRAAAGSTVGPEGFAVSIDAASGAGSGSTAGTASQGPPGAAPGATAPAGAPAAANQAGAGPAAAGRADAGQASEGAAPGYSGTNTAEAGVDEPDLVKTDGRRIVTVIGGVLRVVDAQTKQLTGVLDLSAGAGLDGAMPANLLLAGDHALILFDQGYPVVGAPLPSLPPEVTSPAVGGPGPADGGQAGGTAGPSVGAGAGAAEPGPSVSGPAIPVPIIGPRLLLIDLSAGTPRITSEYTMDGALVDARQVGSVARVVVHSAPRVFFPPALAQSAQERTAANRAVIAHATLSDWLPRYALTVGNVRRTGQVDCAAASHPAAAYSGTSMLTVLTFDLSGDNLGDGQPVTIVADGDAVYSNGPSLYIANDWQWSMPPASVMPGTAQDPARATAPVSATAAAPPALPQQYTGLYKFDISRPGRPVYEASGTVPGWLLGSSGTEQYALSEWNGALRVATTTDDAFAGWSGQPRQSAVYVLEQAGDQLVTIGKVGGLGQGEQIFAVRFAGPVGYVVTFRQVDPLYTIDLSDPAQPRVAGELLLRGYSAYLDPIDATQVIGVGQDANAQGQTQGTQISLFDVSDLAAPVRLAVYHLQFGHSEAEFDPHAFLYWPARRLLVIPVQLPSAAMPGSGPVSQGGQVPPWPVSVAIVLHVGDHTITELGMITHPAVPGFPAGGQIHRSLVIGGALWTLSDTGMKANDLTTLAPLGWVPFGSVNG
jgi:Beta propeller domain